MVTLPFLEVIKPNTEPQLMLGKFCDTPLPLLF